MIYNLSKDMNYHSQRNNKLVPMSSCNTTSAIMSLKASGIEFDYPRNMQPEDYLTQLLSGEEAYAKMNELAPWAIRGGYPPQQVHVMLEWGINKLVGKQVDFFILNGNLSELLAEIVFYQTAPLVSTKFTSYGHIISLVGVETVEHKETILRNERVDLNKVETIIVDDPYGNYHTGYQDHNGNNIHFSVEQFNALSKTQHEFGSKWAHILRR